MKCKMSSTARLSLVQNAKTSFFSESADCKAFSVPTPPRLLAQVPTTDAGKISSAHWTTRPNTYTPTAFALSHDHLRHRRHLHDTYDSYDSYFLLSSTLVGLALHCFGPSRLRSEVIIALSLFARDGAPSIITLLLPFLRSHRS
jgi:hypothetical protein